jgi:hypothetical protein
MYSREGIGGNMPKVKFLQDFQGRETGEVFYKLGQEATLPDHMTAVLIADRRAELVKEADKPIVFDNTYGLVTVTSFEDVTTTTPAPEYSEPDIFVEPQAEEIQVAAMEDFLKLEEKDEPIEDVTTTETIKPKRSKRGKK